MLSLIFALAFATFYTLRAAKKDPSVHKLLTWLANFIIVFIIVFILEFGLIVLWTLSSSPV